MAGPWTDAHCHLADERFAADLDAVLERSRAAGVTRWIQGGVGPDDWQRQRQLASEVDGLRVCVGLHPWWVARAGDDEVDAALDRLDDALGDAAALGELGLDLHPRWKSSEPRQQRAFVAQLARAGDLPVVLHVVRAHEPVLRELTRCPPRAGGLVHAFTGSVAHARRYVELGLYLSLGGALAGRPERAEELSEISLDHIVLETDAPDQAPASWQVDRNEPAELVRVATALAPIWGISAAALLDRAHQNLERLFSS